MPREQTRRRLLALVATGTVGSLAGCPGKGSVRVESVELDAETVALGESVVVSAQVSNAGSAAATRTIRVGVNETVRATRTVEVGANEEKTLVFRLRMNRTGTRAVTVGNRTAGRVRVVDPFGIASVDLPTESVGVGGTVEITATVENPTPRSRRIELRLAEDGTVVSRRPLTVESNSTRSTTFHRSYLARGTHAYAVNGRDAGTVEIVAAWREYGSDGTNRGYSDRLTGPDAPVERAWRTSFGIGSGSSPAVVDDSVYFGLGNPFRSGRGGGLVAVDSATGSERWRVTTDKGVLGTPTVVDGAVVVGSTGDLTAADPVGRLHAFEERTGETRWTVDLRAPAWGSPAATEGTVVAGTAAGKVVAVDPASGSVRWRRGLDGPAAGPALADDTVFVGDRAGGLSALAIEDGRERWRTEIGGRIRHAPAVADDRVYLGANGNIYGEHPGHLVAVDRESGAVAWETGISTTITGTPSIGHDGVFVGVGLMLWGFEAADGAVRWRTSDARAGSTRFWTPAIDDDAVYGGFSRVNGGFVAAFDPADGTEYWRYEGESAASSPALADERLFVGTGFGGLSALEPTG